MASLGFWKIGQEQPDRPALVTPDGAEYTFGELLAETNKVTHGLRALGLTKGDAIATVLPNGAEMVELYMACLQAGLYITPMATASTGSNPHWRNSGAPSTVAVMTETFSVERRKLMRAYGAKVILTPAAERGSGIEQEAKRVSAERAAREQAMLDEVAINRAGASGK